MIAFESFYISILRRYLVFDLKNKTFDPQNTIRRLRQSWKTQHCCLTRNQMCILIKVS